MAIGASLDELRAGGHSYTAQTRKPLPTIAVANG